jgi:pseudouridine-5'-phosphate glycosidase
MFLAHQAGIRLFATGGIGGAHRGTDHSWDISADLLELSRTPVAVVCAGAKSILDVSRTLEVLETHGVPVVGYGTDEFPAFYLVSSGEPVSARVDTPEQAAALLSIHWQLGGAGVVLAQPVVADVAIAEGEFESALKQAERKAADASVRGKELTPFLLARLGEVTEGKTLRANQALVIANARLAARVARVMGKNPPQRV